MAVENDEIGLHARRDPADAIVEAHGGRIAGGQHVKGVEGRKALAGKGEHLVALGRGPQHGIAGAAADIGRDAGEDAGLAHAGEIEQAGAEKQVRGRAEHRRRPARRQGAAFALGQMDAMAEHRLGSHEAVALVDLGIVLRPGKRLAHEGDLGGVLGQMRLDVQLGIFARQRLAGFQLRLGGGRREARRDGVVEPALAMPALDQRLGLLVAGLGRVEQRRGGVAVHHHLAGDHAHAAPPGLGEEGVDAFGMAGAIDPGGGGAVGQQFVEEEARGGLRDGRVAVAAFLREGVFRQPFHQFGAIGGDDLGLGHVQMRVDEARHQQMRTVVDEGRVGRQPAQNLRRLAHLADDAVLDDDDAVRDIAHGTGLALLGRIGVEPQKPRPERGAATGALHREAPAT